MNYELIERLRAGETPETLAEEFTTQLNAAIAQHEEEVTPDPKWISADEILTAVHDFLTLYYPQAAEFFNFTPEEFCELCSTLETMNDKIDLISSLIVDLFK